MWFHHLGVYKLGRVYEDVFAWEDDMGGMAVTLGRGCGRAQKRGGRDYGVAAMTVAMVLCCR